MKKYILPYQIHFFTGILAFAILGFLYSYLIALLLTKPVWKTPSQQDFENCNSNLCNVQKEAFKCSNMICIAGLIFKNNIQAQGYIIWHNIIKPKYFFIVPFISAGYEGMSLGPLLYMNPRGLFLETLLPHGILELFVGYLAGSLFYAVILNVVLKLLQKSKPDLISFTKIVAIQILLIFFLYAVAALLEAIPISIKMGISLI